MDIQANCVGTAMITSQSHRKLSKAGVGQGAGGREVWLKGLSWVWCVGDIGKTKTGTRRVWVWAGEGDVVSEALGGQGQTLGARSGNGWMEKGRGNTRQRIEG
jgi:hypothetical protein